MARSPVVLEKSVTTAGTRVALVATNSSYRYVRSARIRAKHANTGAIFIGDSSVSSTVYSDRMIGSEKDFFDIVSDYFATGLDDKKKVHDLSKWYIDSAVNGEGVLITVEVDSE